MRAPDSAADDAAHAVGPAKTSLEKIESLLLEAAGMAVEAGLCPHEFLAGCQAAYAMKNPTLHDHLEAMHLVAHLDELRRRGRLAQA